MSDTLFSDLGLSRDILSSVEACGYGAPTEVQTRTIPFLLSGRDILATAQTGGGKTASFVLPIIQILSSDGRQTAHDGVKASRKGDRRQAQPRALIIAPTRELAEQIFASVATYGKHSSVTSAVVFGGASKHVQARELSRQPDMLIATPGRLLDFIQDRAIDLSQVRYLVLDEADRMLDMGFLPDVRRISGMTASVRQTVLFSATMPPEIERLAAQIQTRPERVQCQSGDLTVIGIEQSVLFVEATSKISLLKQLIEDRGMFRVLVFTRTKHKAARLAKILSKEGIKSDSIHGDRTQSQRKRALEGFRSGKVHVLTATDVAARGLDVDDISHVINLEMPAVADAETYVHRIGRTGRAGATGSAISFCAPEEIQSLRAVEKLTGMKITVDREHPYHVDPPAERRGDHSSGRGRPKGGGGNGGHTPYKGRNNNRNRARTGSRSASPSFRDRS
ncbi:MAG: DEAD/DEAH box helicase [Spirochaetaceae bacterium]|nr:MAG: DEAD/DEAH box helicase [Spirochaetaceae bacterium]